MHLKSQKPPVAGRVKSQKQKIFEYFCIYTLVFIFIAFIVLLPFLEEEYCLIWKVDGMPQYLLWLKYTGKYIRDAIVQFFHGNFTLPMYDFSIGMGGDVRGFVKQIR